MFVFSWGCVRIARTRCTGRVHQRCATVSHGARDAWFNPAWLLWRPPPPNMPQASHAPVVAPSTSPLHPHPPHRGIRVIIPDVPFYPGYQSLASLPSPLHPSQTRLASLHSPLHPSQTPPHRGIHVMDLDVPLLQGRHQPPALASLLGQQPLQQSPGSLVGPQRLEGNAKALHVLLCFGGRRVGKIAQRGEFAGLEYGVWPTGAGWQHRSLHVLSFFRGVGLGGGQGWQGPGCGVGKRRGAHRGLKATQKPCM